MADIQEVNGMILVTMTKDPVPPGTPETEDVSEETLEQEDS